MSEIQAEVIAPDPVQVAKDAKDYENRMQAQEETITAKAVAREALLNRLGITADEAQLLLGGM